MAEIALLSGARTQKDRAVQRIFEKVINGEIRPGSRLSELAIAAELKISRGPVREAMNQLAGKGWLEVVPGIGSFVKLPTKEELAELYGCREAVECHAVAEACRRITPAQMKRIKLALRIGKEVVATIKTKGLTDWDAQTGAAWMEADLIFHEAILQASGNRQLARILFDLHVMQRAWSQKPDFQRFPIIRTTMHSYREHRKIAAALKNCDSRRARYWMRRHIRRTSRCLLRQYSPENASVLQLPPEMMSRVQTYEQSIARMARAESGW